MLKNTGPNFLEPYHTSYLNSKEDEYKKLYASYIINLINRIKKDVRDVENDWKIMKEYLELVVSGYLSQKNYVVNGLKLCEKYVLESK